MTKFEPALDAAVAYFSNQPGVTPDQVSQLRSTIEADQDVLKGLKRLASTGHLNGFAPSNASVPVGALDLRSGVVALPATALDGSSDGAGNSDLHSVLRVQRMVGEMSASTYPDAQGRPRQAGATTCLTCRRRCRPRRLIPPWSKAQPNGLKPCSNSRGMSRRSSRVSNARWIGSRPTPRLRVRRGRPWRGRAPSCRSFKSVSWG